MESLIIAKYMHVREKETVDTCTRARAFSRDLRRLRVQLAVTGAF
jgi:hypothetical protein